jgi:hypothetical protein
VSLMPPQTPTVRSMGDTQSRSSVSSKQMSSSGWTSEALHSKPVSVPSNVLDEMPQATEAAGDGQSEEGFGLPGLPMSGSLLAGGVPFSVAGLLGPDLSLVDLAGSAERLAVRPCATPAHAVCQAPCAVLRSLVLSAACVPMCCQPLHFVSTACMEVIGFKALHYPVASACLCLPGSGVGLLQSRGGVPSRLPSSQSRRGRPLAQRPQESEAAVEAAR